MLTFCHGTKCQRREVGGQKIKKKNQVNVVCEGPLRRLTSYISSSLGLELSNADSMGFI